MFDNEESIRMKITCGLILVARAGSDLDKFKSGIIVEIHSSPEKGEYFCNELIYVDGKLVESGDRLMMTETQILNDCVLLEFR